MCMYVVQVVHNHTYPHAELLFSGRVKAKYNIRVRRTDVSKCLFVLQAECVSNIQMSVSQRVKSIRGIPVLKSNPDLSVIFDIIPIYLTF